MTKSMVRYEAVATDPTAVWRIASASNWRPSEEPKDLPDLVPSAEWENEKARRSVELRRITPMSTQGKQGMGAPEGNFNPPSTGCSAVPSGWSQNQLPPACPVFPNLNNFNPSHGPELARQCPQYPREIRNQCPFQYQAIQWNLNSGNGSEKDALSARGKNADSNEVDEIQKDEPALKGSDAKTKSNDPTEAPSQPVETNVKTEEMGDRPGKDWVVVRGPEEDNSKMFEAEGDEAKKENAEEKKGVNELGEEDKINKDDVVKTIVQHNLINYLIEGDEIESALKALGLNGSTIQGAHLPFTNSSNVVGHVVEKSFDRQDRGFRGTRLLWTLPPWPGFCTMNCDRFAQHCEYEVIEKFYSVKLYNHSFLYYIDRFEELIKIWPIMNEDYYARVEGREIISNLSKVTGLATMSAALRLGLDNIDENVRNTIAWAFSVMASALDTSALLSCVKTVCQSKKSWQVRHTDIKVVQQTAILMGCTDLPHLKSLVEISEHGLSDENPKVQTITALVEAVAPYGIESFNTVWKPPWKGNRSHLGKVLAAYLINEKLSIDEIKLTPLKFIELIASIKNGTIRGKIGMEKEGFTTIVSIFRSVKCSEEVVDLIKTKTLHAIYDLGILIAKRLCQDHIKVSETQMVPLPTQLDAQVQNDQYENSVESDEQMRPWSENYFDPTTKNWTIQHTGSATCKRGIVQFCYEPIKQIIKTCMNDQKDKLWPMLQKLGMNLENFEPQMLDSYKRVTVSKNDTVILDRAEDKKSIEERAYQARSAIEQSTSDYDKEKLQERLAKLSGGVTVLNIGGASEAEMMGEVGTKHMSYLPDMIPFLRGLPNDETPAVARQAVKTGTNLFATVLEQLVIQGLFLSEGIVDSLNISWEWLLKLKSVVSLMASQHSSNEGVRLLVVKFVEKAVLMYTPDPNISSDPPSEVTEDMGFNVAWLRGGHPLLNVGDLAMDASQSWGLWLEQLKSLKEKSLSTSMIIVFVGSLSAIDQRRHSFYGSILPVLLSLDPASSIIKVQVPGAFYALKSAFIAFLKCTHSSAEPCRAHLWEAQNIINQGDSIEHTVNAARSFGDTSNRAESLLLTEASTDNSNKRSLDEDRNNMLEDDGHSSKRVIQSHDAPEHSAKAKKRNVESASIDVSSSQAALARTRKFEAVDKVIVPDFLIKILEDKYYLEGEGMSEPGNT